MNTAFHSSLYFALSTTLLACGPKGELEAKSANPEPEIAVAENVSQEEAVSSFTAFGIQAVLRGCSILKKTEDTSTSGIAAECDGHRIVFATDGNHIAVMCDPSTNVSTCRQLYSHISAAGRPSKVAEFQKDPTMLPNFRRTLLGAGCRELESTLQLVELVCPALGIIALYSGADRVVLSCAPVGDIADCASPLRAALARAEQQ
jgi:hypothetical protein